MPCRNIMRALRLIGSHYRDLVTVLPCINTELVDTRWSLSQYVDGVAGGVHVVEEVDGQGRESEHQQPEHS